MDFCDKLIELRITINNVCDQFSLENSSKELSLSAKLKVLFLLSQKDMTPNELIMTLGIAKSNLANLSKSMIYDGVIDSYKTLENNRNIYYRITENGLSELKAYKSSLTQHLNKLQNLDELNLYVNKILEILKGNKND